LKVPLPRYGLSPCWVGLSLLGGSMASKGAPRPKEEAGVVGSGYLVGPGTSGRQLQVRLLLALTVGALFLLFNEELMTPRSVPDGVSERCAGPCHELERHGHNCVAL
jgi:hypothetical protein